MATTDKIRSKLVNNRYTMDRRRPTWTKAGKGRKWNDAHEDYEVRVHSMHLRRLLCTNGGKRSIGQRDRKTKMLQSNWLSPVNAQPQQPRPCYLIWPPYIPLHHRILPTTTVYSPPPPDIRLQTHLSSFVCHTFLPPLWMNLGVSLHVLLSQSRALLLDIVFQIEDLSEYTAELSVLVMIC